MATPPREGTARRGLTEDEDVLQVLKEGALKLLLLLSGQLLGDRAAVTQASPEPVGAREARGRSEGETEAHGGTGTLPGCVPWKPHLIPYPLSLGRNLENAVSLSLWESYQVELTPEHLRRFSMEPFSSPQPAPPPCARRGRGHQVALCRAHLFSSTRTFSFSAFCCSLSCWFLAHSSSSLWASLWGTDPGGLSALPRDPTLPPAGVSRGPGLGPAGCTHCGDFLEKGDFAKAVLNPAHTTRALPGTLSTCLQ